MTSNRKAVRNFFRTMREDPHNLPLFASIFPVQDAPVVRIGED